MAVSPAWLRCLIAIAAQTGMRRSDCLKLAPSNCSQDLTVLNIELTKTKMTVSLPINPALAELLRRTPEPDAPPTTPFVERFRGKPVTNNMVDKAWEKARKSAGVNAKLTMHGLRHTIAVSLYELTKDLQAVQQLLGHTSIAVTARYLEHADPEKLRPLIAQLWTPKGPIQ